LKFGYVPSNFSLAAIVPLVKNKSGDLYDANNYRAIALSNAISKILEGLLCDYIESIDDVDLYQFGFSRGLSTGMCSYVFKHTVNRYRQNGSHVFCCFIDFTKAFDSVDYWLLFCKLLACNDTNVCYLTTRLLAYWYSHQQMFVLWHNI